MGKFIVNEFRVGDQVRRKIDKRDVNCWCQGDRVFNVEKVASNGVIFLNISEGYTDWAPSNFELVAKPKEPVKATFAHQSGRARNNDPASSKAAAKIKRTPLRERMFIIICGGHYEPRPEGWTGKELAEHMGVPLNSVTPRFAELAGRSASYKQDARIKDSGLRRDGQIVWVLA